MAVGGAVLPGGRNRAVGAQAKDLRGQLRHGVAGDLGVQINVAADPAVVAGDVVGGGQVNLNSTGTGGSNGGVTNISQFKDVKADAWYASDLSILLSRGIMQGKLEGKFDPLGQLKYGEALKIFLLSAGYSAQEGTGKDWAAGYKTLAVNNGWISSDVSRWWSCWSGRPRCPAGWGRCPCPPR